MGSKCIGIAAAALLAMALGFGAKAQTSEAEALSLVDRYLALHNAHGLDGVMALYAEDAAFTLSNNRGTVRGKEAIRELEMFDVMAGSNVMPFGLIAVQVGNGWRVDLEGVIESSEIFSAAGLPIVLAEATQHAFTLKAGKIQAIVQPEIRKSCAHVIAGAFTALAQTLKTQRNPKAALVLTKDGSLALTPSTIPIVIDLLETTLNRSDLELTTKQISCARLR